VPVVADLVARFRQEGLPQLTAGTQQAETGIKGFASRINNTTRSLTGFGLGSVAVAGGLVALGKNALFAASDLGEMQNKVNVVLEDSSEQVLEFGENSASAFGISNAAALEAAAGFGAMLQSAGLAEQASADMSLAMVELAADMASFNNQDPSVMLEKLRSGLAGEAEPLRQFGVFLSEAAVKAEAYASGIAEVGAELTEAQKVQARYNIIFAQTAKQQGDFARTVGESFPNQLRILKAEFTDTAAEIGKNFIPIATQAVGVLLMGLPVLELAANNLGLILIALGGFAAIKYVPALLFSIGLALERIGAAKTASGIANLAGSLAGLAGPLAVIGATIGAVALGASALGDALDTSALEQVGELEVLFERGSMSAQEYEQTLARMREELLSLPPGIPGIDEAIAALDEALPKIRETTAAQQEVRVAAFLARDAEAAFAGASLQAAASQGTLGQAANQRAEAARAATQEVLDQVNAENQLAGGFLAIQGASNQVSSAQQRLNQLTQEGKRGTQEYRNEVLSGVQAQGALENAVTSYAQELAAAGSTTAQTEATIRRWGNALGLSQAQINAVIDRVNALRVANDLLGNSIKALPSRKDIAINVVTNYSSTGSASTIGGPTQFAQHGMDRVIRRPTMIVAGEAGPEHVKVTPLTGGKARGGQAPSLGRGLGKDRGGPSINIGTINAGIDGNADEIVRRIEWAVATKGW
jgi:hypothetical protein